MFKTTMPDADAMHDFGRRLARLVRAGDLIVLDGELGAGKTTLTQGIGDGLEVDGAIISPTFVIARIHRSHVGGPGLVHVDAYRLGGVDELDDLDLDAETAETVTVVEWGAGMAEVLAADRLEVQIHRPTGASDETSDAASVDTASGDTASGDTASGDTASVGTATAGTRDPSAEPRTVTITAIGDRWSNFERDIG